MRPIYGGLFSLVIFTSVYADPSPDSDALFLTPPAAKIATSPSRYRTEKVGAYYRSLSAQNVDLPAFDAPIDAINNQSLARFLKNFRDTLGMDGTERFKIVRSTTIKHAGTVVIGFVQTWGGIDYAYVNRLIIDPSQNRVIHLEVRVYQPSPQTLDRSLWKTTKEARALALKAWQAHYPAKKDSALQDSRIFFDLEQNPQQRFAVENYVIDVDLISGDTKIESLSIPTR